MLSGGFGHTASHVVNMILAALISGGVGASELLTRYRDDPGRLLRSPPALLYIGVNAAAAILAYSVLVAFNLTLGGQAPGGTALRRVLLAGFAAVALLRTTLFVAKVGDEDVSYGPSQLVSTLLGIADTQVNRRQAQHRAESIAAIMDGVSFERAAEALPAYCLATLEGVTGETQKQLATNLATIAGSDMDDAQKSLILGVNLVQIAGEQLLRASVTALGDTIRAAPSE